MAGGFEKMSSEQFRAHMAARQHAPAPTAKPIFEREIYESASGELVIDIEPMGAPRVTRSSRFGNAKVAGAIARYDVLKAKIKGDCELAGYKLGAVLNVRFEIAMPASWSAKKRDLHRGCPHQQRYDLDNLIKAFMDSFGLDDSHVHTICASKIWAEKGKIVVIR